MNASYSFSSSKLPFCNVDLFDLCWSKAKPGSACSAAMSLREFPILDAESLDGHGAISPVTLSLTGSANWGFAMDQLGEQLLETSGEFEA
jgi:hypothetical protein